MAPSIASLAGVRDEYRRRFETWNARLAGSERQFRMLGNARLATGIAAVVVAAISLGAGWISPWWLIAPVAIFVALAVRHQGVERTRTNSARAVSHYENALARVENRWAGRGHTGDAFRDPKHLFADDLDLFGRGSLFELLCTARTSTGERTLANWLLEPGRVGDVAARQEAVAELSPRLDLREQIALLGEDVRAAVDDRAMAAWGERPAVRFFPGARWIAPVIAAGTVISVALFFVHMARPSVVMGFVLAELIFGMAVRESVRNVLFTVAAPASELRVLGLLLGQLERESFRSARLQALTHSLDAHGLTASAEIRRLEQLVDYLDSARNQFFRPVAAVLLWIPQFAMAIEAWRQECGPRIGQWIAAVGEFEALCALGGFAHNRPDAQFPELTDGPPSIDAEQLRHPLIDPAEAIANDVRLDTECSLWIVSGSNMSGKSTLLRSVGLNTVLAWAGAPVTCGRFRVTPLRIGASIRVNDSLADHRSRFYAEISKLREIVDLTRAGLPTLFLLDELLSGTNSHDRRIGAAALIRGLVERGGIGMVTTHDLALADVASNLGARARNVHFEDHIEGGEIRFDYRLRPGVVERSNALELMRAVGLDV